MTSYLNYFSIILITFVTVGVIAISKKTEKPAFSGTMIVIFLGILLYHTYIINHLPAIFEDQISQTYLCLAMDFLWLLISFLGYLWIDDIRGIKLRKKNYDNSMAWFWSKL